MNNYYVDLHVHIGAGSKGEPVKITASRNLDFAGIAQESLIRKGLNLVGIIDCASPVVLNDIEKLIDQGDMVELRKGGLKYREELVIILGAEVESREQNGGQAHYLAYFPFLDQIKEFSQIMKEYITNINLSSQSTGLTGQEIFQIVDSVGGLFVPAHVFTPHKSFYGRSFSSYSECFTKTEWDKIPAIELGLSADTTLADYISELEGKTFLSNSDAHSTGKIAREYNIFKMEEMNFEEFEMALKGENERKVAGNFGLDPRLGKYHRSFCLDCEKSFAKNDTVLICPECGGDNMVIGVKDRLLNIADKEKTQSPINRPQYIHQVPLADIPGIGPVTLNKLLEAFGTEMAIIHEIEKSELAKHVNKKIVKNIIQARSGKAEIEPGGGGRYGKVMG